MICNYTNAEGKIQSKGVYSKLIEIVDLLAFIGVIMSRGVHCKGVPVRELWSLTYGIPIIKSLMNRNPITQMNLSLLMSSFYHQKLDLNIDSILLTSRINLAYNFGS